MIQRERFEFFVFVEYENLPSFCSHCYVVGHDFFQCRLINRDGRNTSEGRQENNRRTEQQQPQGRQRYEHVRRDEDSSEDDDHIQNVTVNTILQSYGTIFPAFTVVYPRSYGLRHGRGR